VKSHGVGEFWALYESLPPEVQRAARKQFALWRANPRHRSLHFKQIRPSLWSARITDDYRALATRDDEVWLWFWIGTHDMYDRLIRR
jgi:hypothetical protein